MKRHVLRPLWLAIGLVALILTARAFVVPSDFGVHGRNFTYGYHRLGNIKEWQDFPVKYQGREQCAECHEENSEKNLTSKHARLQCENCHGPGAGHPEPIENLQVDGSRELCLRCHQQLAYPTSQRSALPGIDGGRHKRRSECRKCHDPHHPDLEDM